MTDRIDLDELTGSDDEETEPGNRGDWLWREDGDGDEDGDVPLPDASGTGTADASPTTPDDADTDADDGAEPEAGSGEATGRTGGAVPHVPRSNRDRPAGVPESGGGAGAGARSRRNDGDGGPAEERADRDTLGETGPHGGGVDDMTLAFTYRAARRLADPAAAVTDASSWADWIGIVGDVPAHVINKFQREHAIDVDFFNGSGTGPGERLAEVGPHSMFYAERMVLVGVPGEDDVAERADWEFVPLSEAAEGAGWALRDSDEE